MMLIFLLPTLLLFSAEVSVQQGINSNYYSYYYPNNNYNGYWSANGNGYGYGYVPNVNCLYNYLPPYCLAFVNNYPWMLSALQTLAPSDLSVLANAARSYSSFPTLLSTLQTQSPQLYNAYNQMYTGYSALPLPMHQNVLQLLISLISALQQALNVLGGGAQALSSLPNLFRANAQPNNYAQQNTNDALAPNPVPANNIGAAFADPPNMMSPIASLLSNLTTNPLQLNQQPQSGMLSNGNNPPISVNPQQNPPNMGTSQRQQNGAAGGGGVGVGGLVSGILGTVNSALGGRKKK